MVRSDIYQATKDNEILEEIDSIKGELHRFVKERDFRKRGNPPTHKL